jgi:hypothetical protein
MKHNYQRFMILSFPRCGTHMLRTSLNAHPNIVALSEMFNPDWTKDAPFDENSPAPVILRNHVFCDYPAEIAAVGFTIHRSDAGFGNWPHLWRRLEADEQLRVVSLQRENLLRRYVSFLIMVEPKTVPLQPRVFTPEALRHEFERREKELDDFNRRFEKHPLLQVTYEQLCETYEGTMQRVQAFLGLPERSLSPGTVPDRRRELREAIANFDELAAAFASTRWAWFFEGKPAGDGE